MRIHRLINILMKIDQEGKVKAHDMAEALEVSCRTIYRDLMFYAKLVIQSSQQLAKMEVLLLLMVTN